jgi:hypothetical protein
MHERNRIDCGNTRFDIRYRRNPGIGKESKPTQRHAIALLLNSGPGESPAAANQNLLWHYRQEWRSIHFILKDDADKSSYQLDDQDKASKFEGKRVKVTGTLDQANNLIRIQTIEEAAA